jgi:hypothetical protein
MGDATKKSRSNISAKEEASAPPEPAVPIDHAMKKARSRPVAVGGCREDCSDHRESIRKYFQSLTGEGSSEKSISFLEASEMVYNGERLGDRWVRQWKDGELERRTEEIRSFSEKIKRWAANLSPEDMERVVAGGISYGEDDDPGFLVYFRHPPIEGDDSLPVWRYRVQERGWEWLISEIRTHESP